LVDCLMGMLGVACVCVCASFACVPRCLKIELPRSIPITLIPYNTHTHPSCCGHGARAGAALTCVCATTTCECVCESPPI
jgi:hypothetical protein